jgi:hypothetical protein
MAITLQSLKDSVANNLILGGRDKNIITPMLDGIINDGVAMFWRERPWSFSLKTDTFPLVVGQATGYTCPGDCDGIVRLKRESATAPVDLTEMPAHVFDEVFPYPDSQPNGAVNYFKVEKNDNILQIFVMPLPDNTDTVRRTYKIKYALNSSLGYIPDDFRHVLVAACLYQSMPQGSGDKGMARMQAYQEYDMLLRKAMNLDRVSYRRLSQIRMLETQVGVNPNTWQFYLGDYQSA